MVSQLSQKQLAAVRVRDERALQEVVVSNSRIGQLGDIMLSEGRHSSNRRSLPGCRLSIGRARFSLAAAVCTVRFTLGSLHCPKLQSDVSWKILG